MPKLIDICCMVLAMVLAPLACSSSTSANASVFMLVNCSDCKKPRANTIETSSHSGVRTVTVASSAIIEPSVRVFAINTRR
jgi:hypothetical protein